MMTPIDINSKPQFRACSVVAVRPKGVRPVIDLEMKSDSHNFISNGMVVGNSHAVAYTMLSMRCLWLKTYFSREWFAAVLSNFLSGKKQIKDYASEAIRVFKLTLKPVDVNTSTDRWIINHDDALVMPLSQVKKIGSSANVIAKLAPFRDFDDFLGRFGTPKSLVENLIKAGAFDTICAHRAALMAYFEHYKEKEKKLGVTKSEFKKWAKETLELPKAEIAEATASFEARMLVAKCMGDVSGTRMPLDVFRDWVLGRWDPTCLEELEEGDHEKANAVLLKSEEDPNLTLGEVAARVGKGLGLVDTDKLDLFLGGLLANAGFLDLQHWLLNTGQWSDKVRITNEEEVYGFLMPFSHPLNSYFLPDDRRYQISDVNTTGMVDCLIISAQNLKTKGDKPYMRIRVDDGLENLAITIWNEGMTEYGHLLKPGECVRLAVGKIDPTYGSSTLKNVPGAVRRLVKPSEKAAKEAAEAQRRDQRWADQLQALETLATNEDNSVLTEEVLID